jgi:hypothetical protein
MRMCVSVCKSVCMSVKAVLGHEKRERPLSMSAIHRESRKS